MALVRTIRVLSMMEALAVTGPAKNLIAFACCARQPFEDPQLPQVDLAVALFERPGAPAKVFRTALEKAGIRYHVITEKYLGDLSVIPQLRTIIETEQPDILQTHSSKSHFLVRSTGIFRYCRWLAFHHGFTATDWKDRLYNHIGRWALRGAPHVVTVCAAFAKELTDAGIPSCRISIRHNSVVPVAAPALDEIRAIRTSFAIPDDASVILAIGRLSAEKGHLDLIEAAAQVNRVAPWLNFRVLVAGEGPERNKLTRRAADLQIAGRILLPGHQQNVQSLYPCADVFVLPSHSEGSPNVLLEAMSAGLPIVATAVGGSIELVTDEKNALLVKPHNASALSSAMLRLLADRELASRLAVTARETSRQYTPQSYTQAMMAIYQETMSR